MVVSVESTIAGGKSTLLRKLAKSSMFRDVEVAEEPLAMWQDVRRKAQKRSCEPNECDDEKFNMLKHLYEDTPRWGYTFQTWALMTRIWTLEHNLERLPMNCKFLLSERCWKANQIFAKCMHQNGTFAPAEWEMYQSFFEWLDTSAPLTNGYIFVEQSLDTAMERMRARNRSEEECIDSVYQQQLIDEHRRWRRELEDAGTPVLVLDGDSDLSFDEDTFHDVETRIRNFLNDSVATGRSSKYWSERRAVTEARRLSNHLGGFAPTGFNFAENGLSDLYHLIESGRFGEKEDFLHAKCGLAKRAAVAI